MMSPLIPMESMDSSSAMLMETLTFLAGTIVKPLEHTHKSMVLSNNLMVPSLDSVLDLTMQKIPDRIGLYRYR